MVSEQGYGQNPYIETEAPIVVVTGTGPGSGKMSTCLCQLYHDHVRGIASGYAKFETFPIWDLPVEHPVNLAYEAATADLGDFVMLDPFHLEAHGQRAVNYNRDIENFPILKAILDRIGAGNERALQYQSPTDMGVNRASAGIVDDAVVRAAATQEVIRRYFRYSRGVRRVLRPRRWCARLQLLIARLGVIPTDRPVVVRRGRRRWTRRQRRKGNEGSARRRAATA